MRRLIAPLTAVPVALVLAACGDESAVVSAEPEPGQVFTATATVLEDGDHGPQLCLGAVATSDPPQCGGPDIPNWDWDAVEHTSRAGTTYGSYTVVGTYDGSTFTLTEPARPAEPVPEGEADVAEPRFPTPCEEPEGGWAVVDETTATSEAMQEALEYASAQPDYAGSWVDQSINPALGENADPEQLEQHANDPTRLVLNLRFTGDVDRHERELREIWGGALCVSLAEHTEDELLQIQRELHEDHDGILSSGVDSVTGGIDAQVIWDDGSLQDEFDARYGDGVVRVSSALRPVD